MYQDFFDFKYEPFSIAPDPRFLYMSEQHKEALAHLTYGIQSSGAFVVLSGEIGSGKTTVCRCFLEKITGTVDIAFILNPKLDAEELLASICDELGIVYVSTSIKHLISVINNFLLKSYSEGRNTVVVIEEAQNLSEDVLEQLRLLTNLETNEKKLLQIVLLAQPEFLITLAQDNMKQLSQRITARFHLCALNKAETMEYLTHRLRISGAKVDPFSDSIKKGIYKQSGGVPRLINLIADRCLLGAYANNQKTVNKAILKKSLLELDNSAELQKKRKHKFSAIFLIKLTLLLLIIMCLVSVVYLAIFEKDIFSWKSAELPGDQFQVIASEKINYHTFNKKLNGSNFFNNSLISKNIFKTELLTHASKNLMAQWNISVENNININGPVSFCNLAKRYQLACYNGKTNIGLLIKLGRPAILKLLDGELNYYYVVLLGVSNDRLVIQLSDQQRKLSFSELEEIWLGEFMMLSKMPKAWTGKVLNKGNNNPLSAWLTKVLNNLARRTSIENKSNLEIKNNSEIKNDLKRKSDLENKILLENNETQTSVLNLLSTNTYSKAHVAQVKNIQKQAGIKPDGKVGMNTIIYLNSLLDSKVPKLSRHSEDLTKMEKSKIDVQKSRDNQPKLKEGEE